MKAKQKRQKGKFRLDDDFTNLVSDEEYIPAKVKCNAKDEFSIKNDPS